MKNIVKCIGLFAMISFLMVACDKATIGDDEALDYNTGISVVGFNSTEVIAPIQVTGDPSTYNLKIQLMGPNVINLKEDVKVTFSVDEANSTAVAGVNYSLESNSITLTAKNNYLGTIPVIVQTEGVVPPENFTLTLNIDNVETSADKVTISGKTANVLVNIKYLCFTDLAGTYLMTNSVCDPQVPGITISANSDGSWYLSTADGGLLQYCTSNTGLVNDGSILVVCGEVQPSDDLAFCGSNGIGCITGGTWDSETGILTLNHTDTFFGVGEYTSTYIRQ